MGGVASFQWFPMDLYRPAEFAGAGPVWNVSTTVSISIRFLVGDNAHCNPILRGTGRPHKVRVLLCRLAVCDLRGVVSGHFFLIFHRLAAIGRKWLPVCSCMGKVLTLDSTFFVLTGNLRARISETVRDIEKKFFACLYGGRTLFHSPVRFRSDG